MDPFGNVPVFASLVRKFDDKRRLLIVARESVIALLILVFFLFFGPILMKLLQIEPAALALCGGVLLFLIALGMIFPRLDITTDTNGSHDANGCEENDKQPEPFIVPLATPMLAGPSSMASIMIFSSKDPGHWPRWCLALLIAWGVTTGILLLSTRLCKVLGQRFLLATEKLMGMVLTVIALQMLLNGIRGFIESWPH